MPLISIISEIAYKNPRTYPYTAAILSILLSKLDKNDRIATLTKLRKKFEFIPNTGHLDIWLQRIEISNLHNFESKEKLCKLAAGDNVVLWNFSWLNKTTIKLPNLSKIINQKKIGSLSSIIETEEVSMFKQVQSS